MTQAALNIYLESCLNFQKYLGLLTKDISLLYALNVFNFLNNCLISILKYLGL